MTNHGGLLEAGYTPPPGGMPPPGGGYPPPGGPMGPPPGGGYPPPGGPMGPPGGGYPPPGGPMGPPGGGYPPPGGPMGPGGPGGPVGASPIGYGGPPGGPGPKKKGGSGALIAIVLVVGVLVLVGGGLGIAAALGVFSGGSKIKSVAHDHLPKGCQAVVRVNIKGLLKTPALKKHVVPALDDSAKESEDADKFALFLIAARLDPKKDLKEMVLCVKNMGADEPTFAAVLGGKLLENGIVDALETQGDKEKFKKAKDVGGLRVIEGKDDPVFITQASDAALVFGNKLGLVKSAAKTGNNHKKLYELPLDEQIVAVITADAVQELSDKAGKQNPLSAAMKGAGRVVLTASLDTGKVTARLGMPDKEAAEELAEAIKSLIAAVQKTPGGIPDKDAAGLLAKAKIKAVGKELVVSVKIPQKLIEQGAKEVAKGIRRADEEL
jgi:hypothetical protein